MNREKREQKMIDEMDAKVAELTEQIEHAVFLRHNKILENGCCGESHVYLDWVYERTGGSSYSFSEYNGKIRLYIENYRKKKSMFRVKKDGTMDIDAIADEINTRIELNIQAKKDSAQRYTKRRTNEEIVKKILSDHDVSEWTSNLEVSYPYGSINFKVNNLNEEQARAFLALGVDLGVVKQKNVD